MTARLLIAALCPVLFSCSLWMELDKSKLDYSDTHIDDVTLDGESDTHVDIPTDIIRDGPCPDAPDCDDHDDCNDGDPCTMDTCDMECGACVYTHVDGAAVSLDEDLPLAGIEVTTHSPTRIVWTGSEYGVVWGYAPGSSAGNGEIFFTTVSEDGVDVVKPAVRLTNNDENDRNPRLAWTGSQWGVAWSYQDSTTEEIHFVRVNPDSLTHGAPAPLVDSLNTLGTVDLVWSGDRFGLAWNAYTGVHHAIFFQIVDADGAPVGTPAEVSAHENHNGFPSLAWSGTEFGLAWQDERDDLDPMSSPQITDIYFRRVDTDGVVAGASVRITNATVQCQMPSLAWSGTEYGVAYQKQQEAMTPDISFRRISGTGSPAGLEIDLTISETTFNDYPDLTFTGSELGLVYNSNTELSLIRLYSDGTRVQEDIWINDLVNPAQLAPAIVWNGERYAIAWQGPAGEFFNLVEVCE
ncbi:MAG: hypothetical protein JRG91_18300 [Deltaproteobacteria bacterium]|nr:hypothetical protein [Deltaproteobacteria bacterium]